MLAACSWAPVHNCPMQDKILGAVVLYERGGRCHTAAIRRVHGGADDAKRSGSAVSADLRYYMYE